MTDHLQYRSLSTLTRDVATSAPAARDPDAADHGGQIEAEYAKSEAWVFEGQQQ